MTFKTTADAIKNPRLFIRTYYRFSTSSRNRKKSRDDDSILVKICLCREIKKLIQTYGLKFNWVASCFNIRKQIVSHIYNCCHSHVGIELLTEFLKELKVLVKNIEKFGDTEVKSSYDLLNKTNKLNFTEKQLHSDLTSHLKKVIEELNLTPSFLTKKLSVGDQDFRSVVTYLCYGKKETRLKPSCRKLLTFLMFLDTIILKSKDNLLEIKYRLKDKEREDIINFLRIKLNKDFDNSKKLMCEKAGVSLSTLYYIFRNPMIKVSDKLLFKVYSRLKS